MFDRAISEDPFLLVYFPDKYKTQRMCDEAVDDCHAALILFLTGLLRVKLLKNFLPLYAQMIIYSILMKILVMPYLLVMK